MILQGKSAVVFQTFIPSTLFPGIFVSQESLRWQRRALARIKAELHGSGAAAISPCVTLNGLPGGNETDFVIKK